MSDLGFRWLGPLEVWDGQRLLDPGPHKQRAVLAVLLMHAGRVVSLDRLIDLLWGDEPPASATSALQVYIAGLRRLLEPDRPARAPARLLVTQAPGYVLRVDPDACDAHRFEALAASGRSLLAEGRPEAAQDVLAEALRLWRGPALGDFTYEPFAQAEIARLEELRAVAVEDAMEAQLALGQHAHAIAELERLVADRPLRERLWSLLMLALYRSGRQSEALRAYGRARTVLGEELGIEPGPALRRLEADILAQAPSLDWRQPVGPASAAPAPVVEEVSGGLVGRAEPLATVEAALGGGGGVVLVGGEAGIGKTRLAEEVAQRAADGGAIVVWGRCDGGEGAPSFWPWVQIVRGFLERLPPEELRAALGSAIADIAQVVPEVKEVAPNVDPPPPLDPAEARFRLSDAVAGLLTHRGSSRDLLVVVDDLHWADEPSLRLVEFVAGRLGGTRAVLLATYRDTPTDGSDALDRTLAGLARGPVLARVRLEGLRPDDIEAFITATVGVRPSSDVAAAVWARTDGNPFFAGELARLLVAEDALTGDTARTTPVPTAVRDVIRQRMARLPAATNRLLTLAAVAGRDFDVRVVAHAASVDDEEALDQLDPAVALGVVGEDPSAFGRFRFSHALVQEAVRSELTTTRRVSASLRVADALRAVHGDDPAYALELAQHLFDAVPAAGPEPALDAALRAAEVARMTLAYERAEAQLRRGLDLVARLPAGAARSRRELDLHQRLGTLLSMTLGYTSPVVAAEWARALELCRELDADDEVLSSLWAQCRAARSGARYDVLDELGRELLELGSRSPGSAFGLAGHEARGVAALSRGELTVADDHLTAVIVQVDPPPAGIPGTVEISPAVVCRVYLSAAAYLRGLDDEADALVAEALALARTSPGHFNEVLAFLSGALLACLRGDAAGTREGADAVLARHGRGSVGPLASMARAWSAWARGAAPGEIAQALAELSAVGWRQNRTWLLGLLADARSQSGQPDLALAALDEALAEAAQTGERFYEAELWRRRGELLGERSSLERAVAVAKAQGAVPFLARAEAALAALSA